MHRRPSRGHAHRRDLPSRSPPPQPTTQRPAPRADTPPAARQPSARPEPRRRDLDAYAGAVPIAYRGTHRSASQQSQLCALRILLAAVYRFECPTIATGRSVRRRDYLRHLACHEPWPAGVYAAMTVPPDTAAAASRFTRVAHRSARARGSAAARAVCEPIACPGRAWRRASSPAASTCTVPATLTTGPACTTAHAQRPKRPTRSAPA
jgi:hypothetical protein